MLSSYPRTDADYRVFAANLSPAQIKLIEDGKLKVNFPILFRHVVRKGKSTPGYFAKITQRALDWFRSEGTVNGLPRVYAYHHTGAVELRGFTMVSFDYTKKADREQYKLEREQEFRTIKAFYCKKIARENYQELIDAGLAPSQIERLAMGKPPEGYEVHHRIPLDDGGDNKLSNLILMRNDVEHRAVHGYFNPGELAIKSLGDGQTSTIAHILPPNDTVVYPNISKGYLSAPVSNHHIMKALL